MESNPITVVQFNLTEEEEKKYRDIAQELCNLRYDLGHYPSMSNEADKIVKVEKMLIDIADKKELRSN